MSSGFAFPEIFPINGFYKKKKIRKKVVFSIKETLAIYIGGRTINDSFLQRLNAEEYTPTYLSIYPPATILLF